MTDSVNFVAGGTVQAGGGVYIPRQADQELLALCRSGAFAYVLTPRQMGKSSLMVHTADALQEQGIRSVKVDLTTIGTQLDAEAWYLGLLTTVCRQLQLVRQLMTWWQTHQQLGVTQRLTQFFEEVILEEISERIVVFIDEIDTTLNLDFTDDFFIAIRSFYLSRANDPKFVRLSFVLFGVATPSDLIRNPQRTPFNIGQRVDLTDFTIKEAAPLASGFKLPENIAQQVLHWVMAWTGGHPYLTQRLSQTLTESNHSQWTQAGVDDVVERIFFGAASKQDTNLQFVRDMLTRRSPDLAAGLATYREVLKGKQPVLDEEQSLTKAHLKLSGIVKREDGTLQVRNPIYQEVFGLPWVREHLPINWAKRLRRAAIATGVIFFVATLPSIFIALMGQQASQHARALEEALGQARTAQLLAEKRGEDLAKSLTETEAARNDAHEKRIEAEKAQEVAEAAQVAEVEQRLQAEAAQVAEVEQRLQAEAARGAEAEQRQQAEAARAAEAEQRLQAVQAKLVAERTTLLSDLREQATRALNYLSTGRATEGLVLAMYTTLQARRFPPVISSEVLSEIESVFLRASEEVKEEMVINLDSRPSSIALSPNKDHIVSGGEDGTINLWDVRGNKIRSFEGHANSIVAVIFNGNGQRISSVDKNGIVKQWSLDGSLIVSTENLSSFDIVNASFSNDGQKIFATLTDGSVTTKSLSGDERWTEWSINEPLVRIANARLDEEDQVVESFTRRGDSYLFEGYAGQEIRIDMESVDFDTHLILENTSGERIAEDDDGGDGTNSSITVVLPENGTYKIIATEYSTEASGTYTLRTDEIRYIEPPILQEVAILSNTHEVTRVAGENNWIYSGDSYLVNGYAGQEILISMESDNFDPYLILESSTGEIIAQNDDGGHDLNSLLRVVLPEDGTYRVIATAYKNTDVGGSYSLQANEIRLTDPPIFQEMSARLTEGDEIIQINVRRGDFYSIEGEAGQGILVRMESEDFDAQISLQNQEGELVETTDSNILRTVLPETGTYKVIATTSTGETGVYSLVINPQQIKSISISPNGQQLVTALSNGTIQRWDFQGNLISEPFYGHQGEVLSIAFSSDGQRIVSGGRDRTVRLWDLEGNQLGEAFRGHNGEVLSVGFSSDNRRIVSGGKDGTLRLWNLEGDQLGAPLRGHGSAILSVGFSNDDQQVISSSEDGSVRLWEANSNYPFIGHNDSISINGIAFSPDGHLIASISFDKTIRLWDLQGNPIGQPFQGHNGAVEAVAFSPDGRYIVSGSDDKTIRLWDLQGNLIGQPFQGHEDAVWAIAFSPDGQSIVSGSSDRTIRLWDLRGNQIERPFRGHNGAVEAVAFSPDGQSIVSGSSDRTIRLWDLKGNQIERPFQGHQDDVRSVVFSPDGQYIVSGSGDRTIRLWDLKGNPIGKPFQGHESSVQAVTFSPDGRYIASGDMDATIRVWLASWEERMADSCYRLSYHPILISPDESYDESFHQAASVVRTACNQRIWQ
ncbi:MAG: AAA-like domain-containing protein [Cyanobacteria bacterium P01_D01_bin.44]